VKPCKIPSKTGGMCKERSKLSKGLKPHEEGITLAAACVVLKEEKIKLLLALCIKRGELKCCLRCA
jgi:hypothetical protein